MSRFKNDFARPGRQVRLYITEGGYLRPFRSFWTRTTDAKMKAFKIPWKPALSNILYFRLKPGVGQIIHHTFDLLPEIHFASWFSALLYKFTQLRFSKFSSNTADVWHCQWIRLLLVSRPDTTVAVGEGNASRDQIQRHAVYCKFLYSGLRNFCWEPKSDICSPFKAWSRSEYSHACFAHWHEFLPCLNLCFFGQFTSFFSSFFLQILSLLFKPVWAHSRIK